MQQPPAPNPENPASQSGQLYPQAGETPLPPQQVYQQPPMQQMPPNYQAAPLASSGSWPPQPQAYQPQAAAVNINMHAAAKQGPNGCLRVIYFFFIGWWLGLTCLEIGFALCFFIVTLPVGLLILNRLPQIMTLQPPTQRMVTNVSVTGSTVNVHMGVVGVQQRPFLVRAIYYIFVGWWVGYLWATIAYCFCLTFLGLPLGVLMINQLPAVLTLRRN